MFRNYSVKVNFKANNSLTVNFTSSAKYDLQQEGKFINTNGFALPANYSFTRKAAYQYGWDWGPRVLTVGIWRPVNIVIYDDA
jgi:beta-mannosidase